MSPAGAHAPTPEVLADLLADPRQDDPHLWGPMQGDRPASVLVPLLSGDEGLRVLVTRRSPDLNSHAGQYSFPGGRPEPSDADALATALREAEEEVGLPAGLVEVVGQLPETTTYRTGYAITPFVGLIDAPPTWVPQATEVAEVAEPTLAELVRVRELHDFTRGDGELVQMPVFPLRPDAAIWGATARILDVLLARLRPVIG